MSATKLAEKQLPSVMEQIGDVSKTETSSLDTSFATMEDLPFVASLCIMGLEELGSALPCRVSSEKLLNSILQFWANAPCILLKNGSDIIGFYGLSAYVPFYSEDAVLGDYMLFILPKYRSYKAARRLSVAAREFAQSKKMCLELNFITPAKALLKARFLENMGAQIIGVKAVYDGRR